ncbi:MAG: ribosome small subunit-dependent GTPase A [Marinosulfonomonas sp.]|nr:ribosome small subunit-dependent GTPase A [Marinosulfonomonas sp.]
MQYSLADLGWSPHFMSQFSSEELETLAPARIIAVHRNGFDALSGSGPLTLLVKLGSDTTITVGDWVLADQTGLIHKRLDRLTTLSRRAAGENTHRQLIAANVDVMFIVTSCNHDFNLARLERYLVLANSAGCQPVIVLTKPDLCDDPARYAKQAQSLAPDLPVLTVNACDPLQAAQLTDWWKKGQTAALLGSSGVGKSTLAIALTGQDIATRDIRDDDAKGRHTTTSRNLYPALHGGWLLDTPGMRALPLADAGDGIEAVFADLAALSDQCRFRDCAHAQEPGCAIQAEIAAGRIDPDRLRRWQKLALEDVRNSETLTQSQPRGRGKATAKSRSRTQADAKGRKNR